MNTPVSFEIAKALKEKGFEQKERPSYLLVPFEECTAFDTFGHDCHKLGFGDRIGYYIPNKTINAPTIAEVVVWLYEKHKTWIAVDLDDDDETFVCVARSKTQVAVFDNYNSPTEAYEAAIIYTLKNLI